MQLTPNYLSIEKFLLAKGYAKFIPELLIKFMANIRYRIADNITPSEFTDWFTKIEKLGYFIPLKRYSNKSAAIKELEEIKNRISHHFKLM